MDTKRVIELINQMDAFGPDEFVDLSDEIKQRSARVQTISELITTLQDALPELSKHKYTEAVALENAQQANGKRPAAHVRNVSTGEIELVELTPEDIAQREVDKANALAEEAAPKPPSIEDRVTMQGQQIEEILALLRAKQS